MTTVKSASLKPMYKTLKVTKDDGTVVEISRAAIDDYDTVLAIQDRLLEKYMEADLAFGQVISDPDVRSDLSTLCSVLPIVSAKNNPEKSYLNFNDICDNWEQLIKLFFNGSLNEDTRELENLTPSLVSNLHFLPYGQMWNKHLTQKKEAILELLEDSQNSIIPE